MSSQKFKVCKKKDMVWLEVLCMQTCWRVSLHCKCDSFDTRSSCTLYFSRRNNNNNNNNNNTRFLLDDIKTKQLQWYGHVQRTEERRLPKEVMKWRPPERRKRGRPKLTWAERIRGLMGEKGLMGRRLE